MKLENWKPERLKIEKNEKGTFTLSGTLPTGERLRTRFPTKAAAELSKSKILVDLGNTTIERITKLNVEQEEEYLAALKILKNSPNIPEGFTLTQAVTFAATSYRSDIDYTISIEDAGKKYIASLVQAQRAKKYVGDQEKSVQRIANTFGADTPVASITTEQIRLYLATGEDAIGPWKGKTLTPTTLKNHKTHTSCFFSFCKLAKLIKDNPVNRTIKLPKVTDPDIAILSQDEIKDIFEACLKVKPEITIPYFALCIFAGLRPQELCHPDGKQVVSWEDFIIRNDGKASTLTVKGVVGKTVENRVVEIPENCLAWLRPYAKETGQVVPLSFGDFRPLFDSVRIYAGFKCDAQEAKRFDPKIKEANKTNTKTWVADVCRHTALTYYYELVGKNKWIAAEWAGNSPEIYKRNYNAKIKGTFSKTPEEIVADFYEIVPGPQLAA